jgi:hypothetical protein
MIVNDFQFFAITFVVMGIVLFGVMGIWRILFSYEITDKDVRVLLFHFVPFYWIPFNTIVKMHEAPFYEVVFIPGKHFFTRMFGRRAVIETRDTWLPFTFLTPDDPTAFITEVEKHMKARAS